MLRDYFCYPKTGGGGGGGGGGGRGDCALQIKVARDQESIFHFELCVNKV